MYRQVLVLKTSEFGIMHLEICVQYSPLLELKTIDLLVFFKESQCVYCEVGLNSNNFSSLLLDVYVQLNMFRASSRPSSVSQQQQ